MVVSAVFAVIVLVAVMVMVVVMLLVMLVFPSNVFSGMLGPGHTHGSVQSRSRGSSW